MLLPIVEIGGRMMVVVNWTSDLTSEHALLLRPLSDDEGIWLKRQLADAYFDVFARLFVSDEERLSGADFSDTNREAI
jgi:hypothetical protein